MNSENYLSKTERPKISLAAMALVALVATPAGEHEGPPQSLSEHVERELTHREESLRSGLTIFAVSDYVPVSTTVEAINPEDVEKFQKLTALLIQAIPQARDIEESFISLSIIAKAEREADPIQPYATADYILLMDAELQEVEADVAWFREQITAVTSSQYGEITLADCKKYGFEACIEMFEKYSDWQLAVGLTALRKDIIDHNFRLN